MKHLNPKVYENLSPRQRVVASIEAEARGDEHERTRLIDTCPKNTYYLNDSEYSRTMQNLMGMAIAVECDLRGYALGFQFALRVSPEDAHVFLQKIANTQAAWQTIVASLDISEEAMETAGPPRSPFLELMDGLLPEPNRKAARELAEEVTCSFDLG